MPQLIFFNSSHAPLRALLLSCLTTLFASHGWLGGVGWEGGDPSTGEDFQSRSQGCEGLVLSKEHSFLAVGFLGLE